jgi:hypothetical protein
VLVLVTHSWRVTRRWHSRRKRNGRAAANPTAGSRHRKPPWSAGLTSDFVPMTTTSYGESAAELNLATFQARGDERSSIRDAEAAGDDDDVEDSRIERIMVEVVVVVAVAPYSFLSSLCGKQTEGRKIFLLTSDSVIHEQDLAKHTVST